MLAVPREALEFLWLFNNAGCTMTSQAGEVVLFMERCRKTSPLATLLAVAVEKSHSEGSVIRGKLPRPH